VDHEEEHLLGSFPKAMGKLLIPVGVFSDETEARRWLLEHVDPALDVD
jgi:hypothetical protein